MTRPSPPRPIVEPVAPPGPHAAGDAARHAGRTALAEALVLARQDTLATFAAWRMARPALQVPCLPGLNPPVWELGHVGWFQEYWIARHPGRAQGRHADPDAPRGVPLRAGADALYDSSRVPHQARWTLPLPDADATQHDLARQLQATLACLAEAGDDDDALYFFRLALFHEDMHHEAALYMAQALGVAIDDPRWQPAPVGDPCAAAVRMDAGTWTLGGPAVGFAFDNEGAPRPVPLHAFEIDAAPVTWAAFLPFVEDGGYAQDRFWSDAGRDWRVRRAVTGPRHLHRVHGGWQVDRFGHRQALDPALPACHLSWHEAEAWCRWAGRRLPTEHEWEATARERPHAFAWGGVWEWTASAFTPPPGFTPHPYRDYSAPWFDGRPVLRGASFGTQPRMRHPACRNFFVADRQDIFSGFRSCAMA